MTLRTYYYFLLGIMCFWLALDTVMERVPEQRLDSYVKGFNTGVREGVQRSSEG